MKPVLSLSWRPATTSTAALPSAQTATCWPLWPGATPTCPGTTPSSTWLPLMGKACCRSPGSLVVRWLLSGHLQSQHGEVCCCGDAVDPYAQGRLTGTAATTSQLLCASLRLLPPVTSFEIVRHGLFAAGSLLAALTSLCSSRCGALTAPCTMWGMRQAGGTYTGLRTKTYKKQSRRYVQCLHELIRV